MGEDGSLRWHTQYSRGILGFCMAKTLKKIMRELMTKAYIYNMLINL